MRPSPQAGGSRLASRTSPGSRPLRRASATSGWRSRGSQLGAEAVLDIGNHILSACFGVSARLVDHEDLVAQLFERCGVIDHALRERLRGLGGFRNILVHDYLRLDPERVRSFLA
ncbi:MAG: HepT-like ribonuclease domain-containing protein [Candidatus Binatia bacterium]